MARPRTPTTGQRLPRLTQDGKALSNKEISKNIDNWIDEVFAEELRLSAFLDVNTRRQIRVATGIGNMSNFVDQFNNGFQSTSQLSAKKPSPGKDAFGGDWVDRPRLKKISVEGRVVFIPRQKSK